MALGLGPGPGLGQDGDGEISVEELTLILRAQGHLMSKKEIEQLMADIDLNGDGAIDMNEFQMAATHQILKADAGTVLVKGAGSTMGPIVTDNAAMPCDGCQAVRRAQDMAGSMRSLLSASCYPTMGGSVIYRLLASHRSACPQATPFRTRKRCSRASRRSPRLMWAVAHLQAA